MSYLSSTTQAERAKTLRVDLKAIECGAVSKRGTRRLNLHAKKIVVKIVFRIIHAYVVKSD